MKILCNRFGFRVVRQRGSHAVLQKGDGPNRVGTVVPLHPELKVGTLKGILRLARVPEEEFAKFQ
ncbi:MAG: type II toxin-antitoxin system HicA family toxin [Candidatus Thermoplasmatota archaeon]